MDDPKRIVCLVGQPLITGDVYEAEILRCHLCGERYQAPVPEAILQKPKYDPSCKSNIAIARYYMGLPFKRIELWQSMHAIPLADATQWDLMTQLWSTLTPIYQALYRLSAESRLTYFDDTPNKVLQCVPLPGNPDRKGIYTTAIVSEVDAHQIYLFITSHRYAGENLKAVLSPRQTEEPFISMSDGSANNIPTDMDENLLARWIFCFCLVHSRRKFYEVVKFFDKECEFVLDVIGKVYHNEHHCRKNKLSQQARLAYHQEHSLPLLDALKLWLNNKLLYKETEPNSGFGQAIHYMLKHWDGLTRFCHHVGAPLDNSLCERAIKVVIRHRKNSLFYRTSKGAKVGDGLMSIIHTARQCGVDVFDYLNQLQIHHEHVADDPNAWLPWHYEATLAALDADNLKVAA